MKTIICPVDFSETATNALLYACDLALRSGATLQLLHTYHIPNIIPYTELYLQPEINVQYETEVKDRMEHLINWLNKTHAPSTLKASCTVRCGLAVDEISNLAETSRADLIVMGTDGANGGFAERFVGTNTVRVIEETTCPVLVVPSSAMYKQIKHIVYATQLKEAEQKQIDFVMKMADLCAAKLSFVHVEKEEMACVEQDTLQSINSLYKNLSREDVAFYVNGSKDVLKGINTFVAQKNADLLVMVTRRRSPFEELFSKSLTKKEAFHSKIPLLAMHREE
jgi:nucleotide-binding universal stress UspA family protein